MESKVFMFSDFENVKKSGIEFAYTGNSSLRFILREHIANRKLSVRKIRFLKNHYFFHDFFADFVDTSHQNLSPFLSQSRGPSDKINQ